MKPFTSIDKALAAVLMGAAFFLAPYLPVEGDKLAEILQGLAVMLTPILVYLRGNRNA